MARLTLAQHLIQTDQPPVDPSPCSCGRVIGADAFFDARSYDDLAGDWRCAVCFSGIDRQEAMEAEIATRPAPSWSPECEIGNGVRAERQMRLTSCDWTQVGDAPLTVEVKAAWATYRQALRDLTEDYASPDVVVWPTRPA